MGVPGHNEIDFYFAKKYNLPIKRVLHYFHDKPEAKENLDPDKAPLIIEKEGFLINSKDFDYLFIEEAKELIVKHLSLKGKARKEVTFKLRDWLVSRQRYWGAPIPIIYCKICGELPVEENCLPVKLPNSKLINFQEGIPLESCNEFKHTVCHKCGGQAERDTNTLDTFFDSSFYFLRYVDKTSKNEIISLDKFKKWLPVDIYIGGLEHAILHLLYSRFIYRFFLDFVGNLGKDEQNEKYFPAPFEEMITQGIIRGKTIKHKKSGKFLTKDEAEKYQQSELTVAFEKMSKSKMNGINPIQEIEKYGIDIVRLMILFSGPIQQDINYEEDLYKPIINFTKKFSKFFEYVANNDGDCDFNAIAVEFDDEEVRKYAKDIINLLIDSNLKITERSFHVAIARLMECLNILNDKKEFLLKKASNFLHLMSTNYLILLYPFAPHIASEEFSKLNKKGKQFVFTQKLDEKLGELKLLQIPLSDQVKVQVQVNGKFKGVVMVPSTETKNIELILNEASIQIKGFSVNKSEIHKYISPENNKILNLVTAHKKNKV